MTVDWRLFDSALALAAFDLGRFKIINDTYGHAAGDMVLQQASDLATGSVRAGDFVFRYG